MFNFNKNKFMKKFLFVSLSVLFLGVLSASAIERDKVISKDKLPAAAQQFIAQHFANLKVSLVKEDNELLFKSYEVIFTDGSKVEFARDGEWKEVDCRKNVVPASLVPEQVKNYVNANYPSVNVVKIDRDRRDCEIRLSNGLELTFDKDFNIVDIDD
jgi:hypothetical protein